MNKNAKRQTPNTREAPDANSRDGRRGSTTYVLGRFDDGTCILKDEPLNDEKLPHSFDLLERTAQFGENIVRFSRKIPRDPSNYRLIAQVAGAGTSIGANYCEAEERVSKKDFKYSISRCVKEAKETLFFLRMIVASEPSLTEQARVLYREGKELLLIFASIYRK